MSTDFENPTTHYERQAQSIRHSLSNGLNELNQRLTAGQIFDEVMSYAKGGGGGFLQAFSNAARNNPIPSLLIGTGCMLFLSEKMGLVRRSGNGQAGSENGTGPSAASRAASAVSGHAATAGEGLAKGAAVVGDAIGSAGQRMRESMHEARDAITGAMNEVKESAQSLGDSAAQTAEQTKRQAGDAVNRIKAQAARLIDEQPLLAAGIGLAVGAAIAALIPSTKVEDELMGKTSDNLKKSLGETAGEQFESAKAAAGRVTEEAKKAAEREGLTADRAGELVRDLGHKATRVVAETARAGKAELRDMEG